MDTVQPGRVPSQSQIDNRLREKRLALGLSQKKLAEMAGITRQAVAAVETNQYSPATSVALQLARALHTRVEDLFSLKQGGEIIEGELIGTIPKDGIPARAQVTQIGHRMLVRRLDGLGELTSLSASADGLIIGSDPGRSRVKVRLLKDRDAVRRKVIVGGCDPAMFLAGKHVRTHDQENLVPCLMGNSLALAALKRGDVHVAGIHLAEESSSTWKLPNLRRSLGDMEFIVVTFAHWEEGIIVRPGNPKQIRGIADFTRPRVEMINREKGSGARRLLDRELQSAGIPCARVKGYQKEVFSHLEVASRVRAGLADGGVGVRAAATICGLGFIPLQRERYDLIIPNIYYHSSPALRNLLDLIVGKSFRAELEALGGYDTRDTGRIVDLR
jgi:molybdate-binding protein/DNA-binding XRE family transcriptional regulator